ncbi:hypothetical protein AtubIFM55763_007203 [Aspergillus tubingensis]|uniref:SnoaL-like domain-containing protein n=1 Tax=Aspergillus tubingensis TaxID=5068 RepID=A0A9W6AXS6_ASPTU|nr:hypothetical protein AtubIFM54640_002523 [Aspergillus tubingensis]GLA75651.1 hypothetical protein AtubIFM55763_007203 [Aspergillus tubingensis]GLA89432.1 hypothetical protein AtubIFM56815_003909 [Aspergillus tubingensis]GLB23144.1 hypothetical protein AtubIFM61612_003731 [Aspergillus tubingensis]
MSMSTSIPAILNNPPNPQTREDIIDALNRAILGLDTADSRLFDSALFPESTVDLHGNVMNGLPNIYKDCYENISKMDTTHILSNIRVSMVEGDENKAKVTASALAQHYRPGEGNVHAGDGLWKLRNWVVKLTWTEGDWGVFKGE